MFISTGLHRSEREGAGSQRKKQGNSPEESDDQGNKRGVIGRERDEGGIFGGRGTRRGKVEMEAATGGDRETRTLSRGFQDS